MNIYKLVASDFKTVLASVLGNRGIYLAHRLMPYADGTDAGIIEAIRRHAPSAGEEAEQVFARHGVSFDELMANFPDGTELVLLAVIKE